MQINGNICEDFLIKKRIYKNGLCNIHPALCSTFINTLFYHSGHPANFEHVVSTASAICGVKPETLRKPMKILLRHRDLLCELETGHCFPFLCYSTYYPYIVK
jgi:hypothetical protein